MTFVDFWRRRFRIATTYAFADITHGNEILVTNLNSQPVTLVYWELLWLARRWPCPRESKASISPEEHIPCTVIGSGETHRLRFEGQHYFDWGNDALDNVAIYLRLHFAGRQPKLRRIYGRRERRRQVLQCPERLRSMLIQCFRGDQNVARRTREE